MNESLSHYVDFIPTVRGRTPQSFYVSHVNTRLESTRPKFVSPVFENIATKSCFKNGIVVGIGGHMVYRLAALLDAQAIICLDANAMQAVHHGVFRESVKSICDPDKLLPVVEEKTTRLWRTLFDNQKPEGIPVDAIVTIFIVLS